MASGLKHWITVAEAAGRIGCSSRTVLRLAERGAIRREIVNPRLFLVHVRDVEREGRNPNKIGRPRGS